MSSIWYDFYLCEKQRADYAKNQGVFFCSPLGFLAPLPRPPSLFVLLGRGNQITPITFTKSFLQLNYAETRLGQLENCHCEKTCQVSGLLYRDQDSWVDGDNCRNCTCKVSPRRKPARHRLADWSTARLLSTQGCFHHAYSLSITAIVSKYLEIKACFCVIYALISFCSQATYR